MTNLIIILMYVALAGALGATVFSLWRATRSREQSWLHNRIAVSVVAVVVLTLLLSWLIGGSLPDMFIWTVFVLFIIAVISICLSIVRTKYLR